MDRREYLRSAMRIIEGFPAEGISYKDITTVLSDPKALRLMVEELSDALGGIEYDYVLGVEARGFICGSMVAVHNGKGFLMARKPGKLPGRLIRQEYDLEYGSTAIEIDVDSIPDGARIVVMDDLLATGGTAGAACQLVEKAGGVVAAVEFLTELEDLGGRKALEVQGRRVISILKWDH